MALVRRTDEVAAVDISDGTDVVGATKQLLIGPGDGAPTFAVRLFTLAPGGHTPDHTHPFEHGVIVLEGQGELVTQEQVYSLSPNTAAHVSPDEQHRFRNTGQGPFRFLCVVPRHVEQ
ncbi:MAG: cupin domain-containing protein [Candidatus Bipolaricaulota bacterium]